MTFPDLTEIDLTLEDISDCGEQGMTALAVALDIDQVDWLFL